jgi:hypothetical protein
VTQADADRLAIQLVEFLETGTPQAALFAANVFCDFTSPRWREQAQGVAAVVALRKRGHPGPGRVPRWRCDATSAGFVLEVEEEWRERGEDWYCRELLRADVERGQVTALSVYCTGDWDAPRRAEHARTVKLLRP